MPGKEEDLTSENQKKINEPNKNKGSLSEEEINRLQNLGKQEEESPKKIGNDKAVQSQITNQLKHLSISPEKTNDKKPNSEEIKIPKPRRNRRKRTSSTLEGMIGPKI